MIVLKCPVGISDVFIYPFLNTMYIKCENEVMKLEFCLHDEVFANTNKKCLNAVK